MPTWRATISASKATLAQQAAALLRLFEAPHYFRRAGKGRFRKAPAEILQQALAGDRKEEAGAGADRRLGRGTGRRQLPGADPRAAVQDPVQAGQERARIQGRGRSLARHAHRAAGRCCSAPARSPRPTSSTGSASCSRTSPRAPAFPPLAGAGDQATTCRWPTVAGVLDRRLQHHRDRRRALGAGPGHRHGHRRHPHRRARAWRCSRPRRSTRWRASACPPSTCRATRSRCCPTTWCRPTPCMEGRDCPAVSLYASFDEATLALEGHRDAPGARADRRQPAPRPARCASSPKRGSQTPAHGRPTCPPRWPRLREPLSFLFRLACS